jgi:chorismate mutase
MCAGVNRKMHFHLKKLAIVVAFAIGGRGAAYAQNAVEQLQPLVQTTAHRLMIGEQVALAKWDSGKAVEDTAREAQVILSGMKDGAAKGLDEASYANPPLWLRLQCRLSLPIYILLALSEPHKVSDLMSVDGRPLSSYQCDVGQKAPKHLGRSTGSRVLIREALHRSVI